MNRTRLQIAKSDILAFFNEKAPHVLKERQIAAFLSQERTGWRLAQSTTVDAFILFLVKSGRLQKHRFDFPNRPETLYVWGDVPTLEVLLHLKARSYYSHYTAMRFHGLTEQVPKVVYLTHERNWKSDNAELAQEAIDAAFQRPARVSHNEFIFREQRIVLLNGAFTGELGVVEEDIKQGPEAGVRVRTTNVERTLIDAAVRPTYCGGVFEVAKAFVLAKEHPASVNTISSMLQKQDFAYPYHQAIGFYLERAGYRPSSLDLLRRFPREHDFYLTHDMGETTYIRDWRLHVPKGF